MLPYYDVLLSTVFLELIFSLQNLIVPNRYTTYLDTGSEREKFALRIINLSSA